MMRRTSGVVATMVAFVVATGTLTALSYNCGDTWASIAPDTIDGSCSNSTVKKTSHWRVYWVDGYSRDVEVSDTGRCDVGLVWNTRCFPEFQAPYWHQNDIDFAQWDQVTRTGVYNSVTGGCEFGGDEHHNRNGHACRNCGGAIVNGATSPPAGDATADGSASTSLLPGGGGGCDCDDAARLDCYNTGGDWMEGSCSCASPVLVDVEGDGFRLTDGAGGVRFDLNTDGVPERLAWTAAGTDDAWLALDRDGDGRVTSGAELFGNFTPQPAPAAGEQRNGFLALAVYDLVGDGGNSDGVIDAGDAVFARLRLWRDANHDGVSQPAELFTLGALDVTRLHLSYKESKRADEYGNRFGYRAKVDDARGAKAGRWAWDVFLTRAQQ